MMSLFGKIVFVGGKGGLMSTNGGFSDSADSRDIWQPAADLIEIDGGFLVQMDLPGVDAASVEAVVDGQRLLIRGVRRAICPNRSKRYIHMEVSRGEFGKIISLPEPVSEENCSAALRDGVLEIFLPYGQRPVFSVITLHIKTYV
jgi:HSP20 family protein